MEEYQEIKESILKVLETLGIQVEEVKLEHPSEESHGDLSTNVALLSFAQQKAKQKLSSPMELADEIVKHLREDTAMVSTISNIEAVKPGFINFHLSNETLSNQLQLALKEGEQYGKSEKGKGKTMVLDHSHPNIAKRFGIGHLRSTIIGEAIIQMYRFLGWKVISDNFLGDWGTQFGSLIAAIQKLQITNYKLQIEELTIDDLERIYVEFNKKAKDDENLWKEAQVAFKRLEDGDEQAREIWEQVKKVSMVEFEKIWKMLNVKFDYIHAESFFEDKMPAVLVDAKEKKLAIDDQGALIVRVPGFEMPLMLVKSDGATTYETRDLAAIKFWQQEFKPDIIAYEVGSEQALHFEEVFAVSEMLGYMPKEKLIHVPHGLYLGKDGKKMRTRTGDTVKLEEVLEEAVKRAKRLQSDKVVKLLSYSDESETINSVTSSSITGDEIAEKVGIGAVKYFDLSHHPSTNIVFDWEKVFQMDGNSAPYLQYTFARTQSLLEKARITNYKLQITNYKEHLAFSICNLELNSEELAILRHFYKFGEVVEQAATNFSPNLLCNFLFELAQRYNSFYNKHRILGDPQQISGSETSASQSAGQISDNQNSRNTDKLTNRSAELSDNPNSPVLFRLALTQVTGNILKTGLNLLGISAPERM